MTDEDIARLQQEENQSEMVGPDGREDDVDPQPAERVLGQDRSQSRSRSRSRELSRNRRRARGA